MSTPATYTATQQIPVLQDDWKRTVKAFLISHGKVAAAKLAKTLQMAIKRLFANKTLLVHILGVGCRLIPVATLVKGGVEEKPSKAATAKSSDSPSSEELARVGRIIDEFRVAHGYEPENTSNPEPVKSSCPFTREHFKQFTRDQIIDARALLDFEDDEPFTYELLVQKWAELMDDDEPQVVGNSGVFRFPCPVSREKFVGYRKHLKEVLRDNLFLLDDDETFDYAAFVELWNDRFGNDEDWEENLEYEIGYEMMKEAVNGSKAVSRTKINAVANKVNCPLFL